MDLRLPSFDRDHLCHFDSGPSGSSGSGTGSTANVYNPTAQPQADQLYQNVLFNQLPSNPSQTPAGQAYPQAQQLYSDFLAPGANGANAMTALWNLENYGTNTLFPQAQAGAQTINAAGNAAFPAAQQILQTGFDPQSALFNRTQQQVTDQQNAVNAMSGVAGTPYGAGVTGQALSNFDINWQNNLLNRENTAASGYSTLAGLGSNLLGAAQNLGATGAQTQAQLAQAPYNFGAQQASNALQGLGSVTNLGNAQYQLPQQVLNDIQSYLGLGQSASTISGNLGALGLQEQQNALSGIGGLAGLGNTLLGNPLGGLLGAGGTAAGLGTAAAPTAGLFAGADALGAAGAGAAGAASTGGGLLSFLPALAS